VFAAATCEEAQQLWARNTPIQNRLASAAAAITALPEAALDPFGRAAELKGNTGLCLDWPTAPVAPDLAPGPLPDVPALVLSGRDDLRTPLEDAQAVASLLPQARLLAVPRVGHAVLFNDPSGCAARAVAAFFAGGGSRGCAAGRRALDPTEAPPVGLRELDPLVGLPGARGRTVRAALLTLQDSDVHSPTSGTRGGLRGGYLRATRRTVELHSLVFVPGVRVSGLERGDVVRLSVAGSAASRARLTLTRHGVLSGIVGGRRVRLVLAHALAGGGTRGWLERAPAAAVRAR
jgi:TAP-like protein